jgi:hypothetical protein
MTESGDHPITGPQLNRMIIEQRLGLLDSFAVILADECFVVCEMPVVSDGIGPILCHCSYPTVVAVPPKILQSPSGICKIKKKLNELATSCLS